MKRPRTASRVREGRPVRGALPGVVAVLAILTVAGCDSQVGIEGTDYDSHSGSAAASSSTAATAAGHRPPTGTARTPAAPVALATPDTDTAAAVGRWATDLQALPPAQLAEKCWTIAPQDVESMYADKQAVLSALAEPGVADGPTVVWGGNTDATTVVAQRADIATGYACPRVSRGGPQIEYSQADARHVVRRYLARHTGRPLDPADQETSHPLVCPASPATWDPTGSGAPAVPPLATNPDAVGTVRSFVDESITSAQRSPGYLTVSAQVTDDSGRQRQQTFTVAQTERGHCLGDTST